MSEPTRSDLQQQLDAALAEKAQLAAQLAAVQTVPSTRAKTPWPESKVLTRSEHDALTPEQQQAFRIAHGTVTEDPGYRKRIEAEEKEEALRVKALAERAATNAIQAAAAAAIRK